MTDLDAGPAPLPVRAAALDLRVLRALPFATVCLVLSAAGHVLASGDRLPPGVLLLGWVLVAAVAVLGARRECSARAIVGGLLGGQVGLHLLFHAAGAAAGAGVGAGQPGRAQGGTGGVAAAAGMPDMSGMPNMTGMAGMAGMPSMPGMPGMSGMPGMQGMADRRGVAMTHVTAGAGAGTAHHTAVAATHLGFWCHATLAGLSPAMLLAHLAATLAAGWWLRRGEAAVWALVRIAARVAEATGRACAAQLRGVLALFTALRDGLDVLGSAVRRASGADRSGRACSAFLRHTVIRRGPPGCATA
ncbi:hypothetical protein AB0F71_38175 [Kitasatospora sp. NPDC028055]|uniref:hypothetical protein n=1 Tax=Kitasatospora sp. NPDC028055 TaxID=3155653 RepID=UPI003410726F